MSGASVAAINLPLRIDNARIRLTRAAAALDEIDIDIVGARGVIKYAVALANAARDDLLTALRVDVNADGDAVGDEDGPVGAVLVGEGDPSAGATGTPADALDDLRRRLVGDIERLFAVMQDRHDDSSSVGPTPWKVGDASTVEATPDTPRCDDSRRGVSAGGAR